MSKAKKAFDLTKQAPRSCYVRLGGYVILPRLIDKLVRPRPVNSENTTTVPGA